MNEITSTSSQKPETEAKYLHDEIMTLKMAIEEAIMKGQKSLDLVSDIPEAGMVFDEDFATSCGHAVPGVVGWIDDL